MYARKDNVQPRTITIKQGQFNYNLTTKYERQIHLVYVYGPIQNTVILVKMVYQSPFWYYKY